MILPPDISNRAHQTPVPTTGDAKRDLKPIISQNFTHIGQIRTLKMGLRPIIS